MKNKSWLQDNIVPIIALTVIAFCCSVLLIILLRGVKSTDTNTTIILTGTFNVLMLILGFYFVASKSSKEKDKAIADMITNKPNEVS